MFPQLNILGVSWEGNKMQWFKLYHGFSTDTKLALISHQTKIIRAIVNSIVIDLLEYASHQNERGSIQGYNPEVAAFNLGIEEITVVTVCNALRDRAFITGDKINNWDKYQPIDKTNAERQKRYRERVKEITVVTDSNALRNIEEKRGEEIREEKKESKNRGTRFALQDAPVEWLTYCELARPDLNAREVFNGFRDYWIAKSGKDGIKLDWLATWRNWIRNQKQIGVNHGKPENKSDRAKAAIMRGLGITE